ncbi:ribosome assembly RNA-binding protein YhbY [Oceanirhabdus sp. W0125-5]|uniref:ribosome assembly RNA-binding protein YhbY n=1 Tax=Oceanirhabdus sp. W0125-5 TaxID=2999116 RepID=UPI0022F2FD00|nr:ribosome assembly RNA-binding protein YhbY [Oceanirhabdus sp. W0125-5]WBW95843.1 ribosome assembly RNA-binding protein YhbY [Oceanirhabdus sp. W0125-5]
MLNSKQRAYLRKMANTINPIFQVGKNGVEDEMLKQLDDVLEKRELIKIKILKNSFLDAKEAASIICEELECDTVQFIGHTVVLYRESKKKPTIELP